MDMDKCNNCNNCNDDNCNDGNNYDNNDNNNDSKEYEDVRKLEAEIKYILEENKCEMMYALDDIDRDRGYIGIDLYFKADSIGMGRLIEYLYECLKIEYSNDILLNNNNKQQNKKVSEEIALKDFINDLNNSRNDNKNKSLLNDNNNDDELIKSITNKSIEQWEKEYRYSNIKKYALMILISFISGCSAYLLLNLLLG